jgi:hypothetical protein
VCAGGRVWLAAFALAALASPAANARGQAAKTDGLATIVYEAPASCPDRAEFLARIAARTSTTRPPDPTRAPPRLRVRIRVLAGRVVGSIAIEDADGAMAGRQIRAATCDEASDALALIAALALDPERRAESLTAETGLEAGTESAGAQGATTPTEGDRAAGADAAEDRSAPEAGDDPDTEDDADDDDDTGAEAAERDADAEDDADADDDSDAEDDAAPAGIASQRLAVAASALALSGVLPDAAPGFALFAAYAIEPRGLPEFALRAGFAITPAASEEHPQGVARFSWWSALLALCSGVRNAGDSASLWLCAAGEVGQLAASGRLTLDPREEDRSWAALGPALLTQWEPLRPLLLQAGVGAAFALVRDRFLLGNEAVHRAPRLGVRVDLGVGIRIW